MLNAGTYWALKTVSTMSVRLVRTVMLPEMSAAADVLADGTEDAELADALALAELHGLTVYDAAYASVARSRHARLATLDRLLLGAGLGERPSEIV